MLRKKINKQITINSDNQNSSVAKAKFEFWLNVYYNDFFNSFY